MLWVCRGAHAVEMRSGVGGPSLLCQARINGKEQCNVGNEFLSLSNDDHAFSGVMHLCVHLWRRAC
jgi:hypothetical protein